MWNSDGIHMELTIPWPFHDHSMTIPWSFHMESMMSMEPWIGCGPSQHWFHGFHMEFHMDSMDSRWILHGIHPPFHGFHPPFHGFHLEFLQSTPHSMDSIWINLGRVKYCLPFSTCQWVSHSLYEGMWPTPFSPLLNLSSVFLVLPVICWQTADPSWDGRIYTRNQHVKVEFQVKH